MLSVIACPIRHDRRAYAFVDETLERQLRHLARTEHHRTPTGQRAEDLLRELDGGRAHRRRAAPDVRLVTHAPRDEQRRLKEAIQHRAAVLTAVFPGRAHLPVYLCLAENHRVEARCDTKQVRGSLTVPMDVAIRRGVLSETSGEQLPHDCGNVSPSAEHVDLGAIAGGERNALDGARAITHLLEQWTDLGGSIVQTLPN